MAENSKNVLHGTKLTGLWPKNTFLSRSSKKLQIWHGTTLLLVMSETHDGKNYDDDHHDDKTMVISIWQWKWPRESV